MTHSLHREGSIDSLGRDYVLFIFPARGFNYSGSTPKVRRLMEIAYQSGPSNALASSLRRNLYSGVRPDEILDSLKDGDRAYAVFNSKEKIREVLLRIQGADEGISIIVSGLIDQVKEITEEMGIDPHTINVSLGVLGNTEKLPAPELRQYTTMCGHGMISANFARKLVDRVKEARLTPEKAAGYMAKFCVCGAFNLSRAIRLLRTARQDD